MRRAEAAQFLFPERIHSGECYSGISLRKEEKTLKKCFEWIATVT